MFKKILLKIQNIFKCGELKKKYEKRTEEEFYKKLKEGLYKPDTIFIQNYINELIMSEYVSEQCKEKIKNHIDHLMWRILVPKYRSHIAIL